MCRLRGWGVRPLRPFFRYFGSKWRAAPRYPTPSHRTIVEPFAGSAGYSLRYPDRDVVLVERDPVVASVWRYLLAATPEQVRALPDVPMDGTIADVGLSGAEAALVGFWCGVAQTRPARRPSAWMRRIASNGGDGWVSSRGHLMWSARVRERIAEQLPAIRHWRLVEGDYRDSPDVAATWFVDPPYHETGRRYRCGAGALDYAGLADWCRSRTGQVVVCENDGADWLPFEPVGECLGANGKYGREVAWVR